MGSYKRRFGDRYDGRLIRSKDPFFKIIPYVMKKRIESQVFFEEKLDISKIDEYLRIKRADGIKNIGFLHVLIAAMIRTISQKPRLNRFIAGQKVYARNEILIALVVKKELTEASPETTIIVKFEPEDSIFDVVNKLNTAIEENKKIDTKNGSDLTAGVFMKFPGFIIKFLVRLIEVLDYFGILPGAIKNASPFHTTLFVTDLGSLGIQSVFHHLYEIGTTSIFLAFGMKYKERHINSSDVIIEKKYISIKITCDERISDGFYLAKAFNFFKNTLLKPEKLELPPDTVVEDV